jgi:predicted GH43/DUF377 family glycosyl hydrolase
MPTALSSSSNIVKTPVIRRQPKPLLVPPASVPWASTMVLNPALLRDERSNRLHMLFRASGPGKPFAGRSHPLPYPICLGYAWSDDDGETWTADFDRPALYPRLAETFDALTVQLEDGRRVLDYANGCIEDPRLFAIEGTAYLSAACRVFPPGPYWLHDDPLQCTPAWAREPEAPGGRAIRENLTVSVLYRVDLDALAAHRYAEAFTYLGPLSDPERSDNRDVFLFPERLQIQGAPAYVMVHRPKTPQPYAAALAKPTMFIAAARSLPELATQALEDLPLAAPLLAWEANRVGGSSPPLRIDRTRWLLPYHGKQDDRVGYTQSFLILEEVPDGLPVVRHRCSERLFFAEAPWEKEGEFVIPCVFTCGAVRVGDDLLMTYGAADTVCGVAWTHFDDLVRFVETFDADGHRIDSGAAEVAGKP